MNRSFIAGLLCLIVFCVSATTALSGANGGEWMYGSEITIREQTGTMLDFYSLPVALNAGNFDFSKANPDGSDIRVTDHEGYERAFWIEEWNSSSRHAKLWISIPRIPPNGATAMRLYYGNPKATGMSNGGATFLFFDDFNGPSLNSENWVPLTSEVKQENGHLRLPSGKTQVTSMIRFTRPLAIQFRYRTTEDLNPSAAVLSILAPQDFVYEKGGTAYTMELLNNRHPSRSGGLTLGNNPQSHGGTVQASFDATGWNLYDLRISEDSVEGIWGGSSGPVMRDTSLSSGTLALSTTCPSGCRGSADWDWLAVRKYARMEPAVTLSPEYPANQLMQKAENRTSSPAATVATESPGFIAVPACFSLVAILLLMKKSR